MDVPPSGSDFWDEWITRANVLWAALMAVVAAIGSMYVKGKRDLSSLRKRLNEDRSAESVLNAETVVHKAWLSGFAEDRERKDARIKELEDRNESLRESELNTSRQVARLEATLNAMQERVADMAEENARLLILMSDRETKLGGCEEKIRAAADEKLAASMYIEKLQFALMAVDPAAAKQLFHERWDRPKILTSSTPLHEQQQEPKE